MKIAKFIDSFVEKINARPITGLEDDEVPEYLRLEEKDEHGLYRGKILRKDCSDWIDGLLEKLPVRFPPSYYSLVSRYAFPPLEIGPITFFANTGEKVYHELADTVFVDKNLYPTLLDNGLVEFGKAFGSYDPVCFDSSKGKREHSIIRADHEEVLIHQRIKIVDEIALSFIDFIKDFLETR